MCMFYSCVYTSVCQVCVSVTCVSGVCVCVCVCVSVTCVSGVCVCVCDLCVSCVCIDLLLMHFIRLAEAVGILTLQQKKGRVNVCLICYISEYMFCNCMCLLE